MVKAQVEIIHEVSMNMTCNCSIMPRKVVAHACRCTCRHAPCILSLSCSWHFSNAVIMAIELLVRALTCTATYCTVPRSSTVVWLNTVGLEGYRELLAASWLEQLNGLTCVGS